MSSNESNTPEFSALSVPSDDQLLDGENFGTSVEENFDPLAGAEEKRRIDSGIILMGVVVVLACGGLFSMRWMASAIAGDMQSNPDNVDATIDRWFALLSGTSSVETEGVSEEVLGQLDVDQFANHQVALQNVQRNPFILGFEKKTAEIIEASTTMDWDPDKERQKDQKRRFMEFQDASKRLVVTSIMAGENPLASVNNRVVQLGGVIVSDNDVSFTVVAIDNDGVAVKAYDESLDVAFETTVVLERN